MADPTPEQDLQTAVLDRLKAVKYPGFNRDIVSFGMVKDMKLDGGTLAVGLRVPTQDARTKQKIFDDATAALRDLPGVARVEVEDLVARDAPKPLPTAPGGGGPAKPQPFAERRSIPGVKRIIASASGKGGVGKSMVTVNLASALAERGFQVGVLDADVYGPSIPTMLGVTGQPVAGPDRRIQPIFAGGLKVMSLGFLMQDDLPAIWRGPMVMRAISQFLHEVAWGELDYLVIDLPPGTGDAQLTLVQQCPLSGGIIVTTPQEVALAAVRRGIRMFREVDVPVFGVVENMSYYKCPDCNREEAIFTRGGGKLAAERYGVPFLGEIPIDPRIAASGDEGTPMVRKYPESDAAKRFFEIADKLSQLEARAEAMRVMGGMV